MECPNTGLVFVLTPTNWSIPGFMHTWFCVIHVSNQLPPVATHVEVAEYLRTTTAALAGGRYKGTGPKFIKRGSRVLCRWSDVLEWLDRNTIQRTDERRGSASNASPPRAARAAPIDAIRPGSKRSSLTALDGKPDDPTQQGMAGTSPASPTTVKNSARR